MDLSLDGRGLPRESSTSWRWRRRCSGPVSPSDFIKARARFDQLVPGAEFTVHGVKPVGCCRPRIEIIRGFATHRTAVMLIGVKPLDYARGFLRFQI